MLILVRGGRLQALRQADPYGEVAAGHQALAGSIAHEMRNPLGQIRYSLEGMQQALPPPTTTPQAQTLGAPRVDTLYRHLAESEMAVKRGLQVIAMTLDEVSAKPVDTSAFSYLSAAAATEKAVQEYAFASDAERSRVRVHVIEDFDFRADETAYLFVLFNLIKNALYYMALDPGARVTVTVAEHQVQVHDTGPGIAPDALAKAVPAVLLRGQGRRHRPGSGLLPPRHARVRRRDRVRLRSGRIHASSPCAFRRSTCRKARPSSGGHGRARRRVRRQAAARSSTTTPPNARRRAANWRHWESQIDEAADGHRPSRHSRGSATTWSCST